MLSNLFKSLFVGGFIYFGMTTPSWTAPVTNSAILTAVGYYIFAPSSPLSYISLDNGNSWQVSNTLPAPLSNLSNQLFGISCYQTNCVAVGTYSDGIQNFPLSYTSTDNGINWVVSTTLPPALNTSTHTLQTVSCDNANNCVAMGNYVSGAASLPLAYTSHDNGKNWIVATSLPIELGSITNSISSVSCDYSNHCVAVGYYLDSTFTYTPLCYTSNDNGQNWALSPAIPILNSNNRLQSVSCDNNNNCVAVGLYSNGSLVLPLSYTSSDNGSNWILSVTQPPEIVGSNFYSIGGINCNQSGHCILAGTYANNGVRMPLAYLSNDYGKNWLMSTTQPPMQNADQCSLTSAFCDNGNYCTSVGYCSTGMISFSVSYVSTDGGNNWRASTTQPPIQSSFDLLFSLSGNGA
ncbi:MAG: exo-alpha-sialidase [Proteobacteria bacterium]|nr:exo-alpha-sialidase [Pseudomonadota bacterium]